MKNTTTTFESGHNDGAEKLPPKPKNSEAASTTSLTNDNLAGRQELNEHDEYSSSSSSDYPGMVPADEPVPISPEKDPTAANVEAVPGPRTDVNTVEELLQSAKKLYIQSKKTRRKLLYQRVELGRILIQLKDAVGHGNFILEFKKWIKAGRIGFSLKTGQRAMAYAELEEAGKFVDDGKNDIVSNLAEAERLRKAKEDEVSNQDSEDPADDTKPVTLTETLISPKAKKLAGPILEECRVYDGNTKTKILEELIELLTEELEKCST